MKESFNEFTKEQAAELVDELLNKYKEGEPEQNTDEFNTEYKVRNGWFQGVVSTLRNVLESKFLANDTLEKDLTEFIKEHTFSDDIHEFEDKKFTQDDVRRANNLLARTKHRLLGETI